MRLYTFAAGFFTAIILVAHAIAPAPYSWTMHEMSQLGAQGYEYAYIMRFGLISYGALVVVAAILKVAKRFRTGWPNGFIGIYGFAILLTGFFSTAPFRPGVPFTFREMNLHSTFGSLAVFALSTAMVAFTVMAKHREAESSISWLSFSFGSCPKSSSKAATQRESSSAFSGS
jgi:hypothetical membrane protein